MLHLLDISLCVERHGQVLLVGRKMAAEGVREHVGIDRGLDGRANGTTKAAEETDEG